GAARAQWRRQDHLAQDLARHPRAAGRRGRDRRPPSHRDLAARARASHRLRAAAARADLRLHGRERGADGPHRPRHPVQPPLGARWPGGRARARAVRHRASGGTTVHDDLGGRAPARFARPRAGAGAAIRGARRADREPRLRQPGQGDARDPRACRRGPWRPLHHARSEPCATRRRPRLPAARGRANRRRPGGDGADAGAARAALSGAGGDGDGCEYGEGGLPAGLTTAGELSRARTIPYIVAMKPPNDTYRIRPDPLDPRLTERVSGVDQTGQKIETRVTVERALSIFLNSQEIVTAMTINDYPEYLALGYLLNQNMLLTD